MTTVPSGRWGAHALTRAWPAIAGIGLLLPLHAAAWLDGGTLVFLLSAGLAVLSAWRPAAGLSTLILLLPGSILVERMSGGVVGAGDVVDSLVLMFAGGASFRLLPGAGTRARLAGPAGVLAVVVATSVVIELRTLQLVTPRVPILPDVWRFVTVDFWSLEPGMAPLRHGFRWLAWLATAVFAERIVVHDTRVAAKVLRAWFISGAIGALLVLQTMFQVVLARRAPFWSSMADFWQHERLSVLQPDLNAAASYLLLLLVPALVVGVARRAWWLIVGVVPLLLLAFALARSRAAVGAGVAVFCLGGAAFLWRHRTAWRRGDGRLVFAAGVVAVFLAGAGVLLATNYATAASNASLGDAMRIRVDLMTTGFEVVKRKPVFGIGLSDYIRSTRRFVRPEMTLLRAMAPRGENAHNNFLQIAVELGVPACVLFLWLVVVGTGPGLGRGSGPDAAGMSLGVVAFLISAVFGHPLLVPLVGTWFFLALGLAAGFCRGPAHVARQVSSLYWVVAGMYVGSLVWRW